MTVYLRTQVSTTPLVGVAMLAVRLVQGWIFWGGGSRRLLYATWKLNPHAPHWMANKLQAAIPGAVLGISHPAWALLAHPQWLLASLVTVSVIELLCGISLILGLFTRGGALASILLSAALMPLFGWQGATCIDEWTMSAATLAMGVSLFVAGGGTLSLDHWLLRGRPLLAERWWARWLGSAPWPETDTFRVSVVLALLVFLWSVGFYSYYRGAVFGRFHHGPVSPSHHALSLSAATLRPDGSLSVRAYVSAGTPAVPAHIIAVTVEDLAGRSVERWGGRDLSHLPKEAFVNDYPYNRFAPGVYGLKAPVGSVATLHLPGRQNLDAGQYKVVFQDIDGRVFEALTTLP